MLLVPRAGRDASSEFDPIHSSDAREMTLGEGQHAQQDAYIPFRLNLLLSQLRAAFSQLPSPNAPSLIILLPEALAFSPLLLPAEYLIGKLKGAQPPFQQGVQGGQQGKQEKAEPAASPAGQEGESHEEDEPALKKGRVLMARLEWGLGAAEVTRSCCTGAAFPRGPPATLGHSRCAALQLCSPGTAHRPMAYATCAGQAGAQGGAHPRHPPLHLCTAP